MDPGKPKVLIIGITGFLGSHVCLEYLRDGSYQVRGTVRDLKNESKLNPLKEEFGEVFASLEVVEADLLLPETIDKAVQGCQYVVHTAAPVPGIVPQNDEFYFKPAVEGTLAVMKACQKHKVKRLVITSTVATMLFDPNHHDPKPHTEACWSDPSKGRAYDRAKTISELAIWDFQKNLPQEERFEVVTLHPSGILGPNMIYGDFGSGSLIALIMKNALPGMPLIKFPFVDVRDCALTHLQAMKVPEAANQRFIVDTESYWFREVAQILKEAYGEDYEINTEEQKECSIEDWSFFWNREMVFDNSKSKQLLGISYRPIKTSLIEMVPTLIKYGQMPDQRKQK